MTYINCSISFVFSFSCVYIPKEAQVAKCCTIKKLLIKIVTCVICPKIKHIQTSSRSVLVNTWNTVSPTVTHYCINYCINCTDLNFF